MPRERCCSPTTAAPLTGSLHPSFEVPRTYLVKVKGAPTDETLQRLLEGVRLEDGPARAPGPPASVPGAQHLARGPGGGRPPPSGEAPSAPRWGTRCSGCSAPRRQGGRCPGWRPERVRPLTAEEVRRVEAIAAGSRAAFGRTLPCHRRRHGRSGDDDDAASDSEPESRASSDSRGEAPRWTPDRRGAGSQARAAQASGPKDRRRSFALPSSREGASGRPARAERGQRQARSSSGSRRALGRGGRFGQERRAGDERPGSTTRRAAPGRGGRSFGGGRFRTGRPAGAGRAPGQRHPPSGRVGGGRSFGRRTFGQEGRAGDERPRSTARRAAPGRGEASLGGGRFQQEGRLARAESVRAAPGLGASRVAESALSEADGSDREGRDRATARPAVSPVRAPDGRAEGRAALLGAEGRRLASVEADGNLAARPGRGGREKALHGVQVPLPGRNPETVRRERTGAEQDAASETAMPVVADVARRRRGLHDREHPPARRRPDRRGRSGSEPARVPVRSEAARRRGASGFPAEGGPATGPHPRAHGASDHVPPADAPGVRKDVPHGVARHPGRVEGVPGHGVGVQVGEGVAVDRAGAEQRSRTVVVVE
jgi:23S rRNA pseudouridine2605 synthase